MADRVLILGASARAAAASARRAGLDPFAIDLFADADTRQICDCLRCPPDRYPEGLFELAKQAPPMPWMYTGGLENYPELIGELARDRELWGNGPVALERVRNPYKLSVLWSAEKIAHATPHPPAEQWPIGADWLWKPIRGSSGAGVRFATPADTWNRSPAARTHYLQQFIPGRPMSVLCAGNGSKCVILGVTSQLIGTHWLRAKPFHYAGSIGPTYPRGEVMARLKLVCSRLVSEARLRGIFGVDFILSDTTPYPVEVNPRYPASVELVEYDTARSAVNWHRWGCDLRSMYQLMRPGPPRMIGKAIYFAPQRVTFPASGPWDDSVRDAADVWRRPDFADVPHPGEVIEAGHPVLTILTEADTESECLSRLQSRAAELDRLFGFPTPEGESCRH